MALQSSGVIAMSDVNVELEKAATALIALNDEDVRTLLEVASGQISLSNAYGKSNVPPFFDLTISSNVTNANLRTLALNAGWDGTSEVIATINAGVYVYSTSTATPGLTIDGSWPGGLTLINNGFIMGMGATNPGQNAGAGGTALSLGTSCAIRNNSYIAGGGGGGGLWGGGGAGGGTGGSFRAAGYGGAGGAPGSSGSNGTAANTYVGSGGGGRILPGVGGASYTSGSLLYTGGNGGGSGGSGYYFRQVVGSCGGPPRVGLSCGGGGGGWGASGGYGTNGAACGLGLTMSTGAGGTAGGAGGNASGATVLGSGGAGGKAVALNGSAVTWLATGTRYGAVS